MVFLELALQVFNPQILSWYKEMDGINSVPMDKTISHFLPQKALSLRNAKQVGQVHTEYF